MAKVKDSKKSVRLIVDMLRSGSKWRIVVGERLVLPSMTVFAELIVDLLETQTVGSASRCEPRLRHRRRHGHAHHLRAGAPETKTAELKDALLELLQANVLNTRLAVCAAGLASWAPIAFHLWRAISHAKKQKEVADVCQKVPPQRQVVDRVA